jgi:type VI protein secretion system component VasK
MANRQGHLLRDLEDAKAMEVVMSLAMTIFSLIAGWLAVAAAMLWGVLRIARRHQHQHQQPQSRSQPAPPVRHRTATVQHV